MDDDLIGQLLDTAAGRLSAYGYVLTGSRSAGEGLLQDAIVRVFARHRRVASLPVAEGQVRVAMRAIHLNEVRRVTSWRANLPTLRARAGAAAAQPYDPGPMGRAMARLSPQERAAVVLRHHDHLAIPEIAVAMRAPETTVERYLSQALAALSRTLGDIEPEFDQVLIVDRSRR